jgi:hypothetical protein
LKCRVACVFIRFIASGEWAQRQNLQRSCMPSLLIRCDRGPISETGALVRFCLKKDHRLALTKVWFSKDAIYAQRRPKAFERVMLFLLSVFFFHRPVGQGVVGRPISRSCHPSCWGCTDGRPHR